MQTSIQNPFKFLDSFNKEDKDRYFGRDSEIEALYELLSQTDLVLLYGETGTGKTSLVNCGLAKQYDDTDWLPIYIRRNRNINQSIREELKAQMKSPPTGNADLPGLIQAVYWEQLRPVYLIFDQLEELFIIGTREEQEAFIQSVQTILDFEVETKIIFVFREEYLAHLNSFEPAIPTLFDKRLRIEAMRETKAAEVITRTCEVAGIYLASEQVPKAILEVITEEGRANINLPYLQVFLDKMFKKAAEQDPYEIVFDEALIREVGNLGNVLTRFLEDQVAFVQDKLGEKSSVWLFLKFFVTPDGTKKPVYRSEVYAGLGKMIHQSEKIDFCLNYFTNSHILRPLEKGQYELTHDSIAAKIHRARLKERIQIPLVEGNPYKGLAAYDNEDSNIFFGRDKVVQEVYRKMVNQPLIVITGASGAGKSSLVKAGLLPKLKEEGYQNTPMFRPGNRPLERLEEVLEDIRESPAEGKGFVILIDQYEELITRTEQEAERDAFVEILRKLIEQPETVIPKLGDRKVKLLITVRADFEPQFEQLGLKAYWYDAKYVIPLLSRAELMEIVEKPAYLAATYFEPEELIDRMVDEVLGGAGSLPLLSFALSLLFERCKDEGRIITEEAYKEIGGVIGSLKTHADEIYHGLDTAHRQTMERIMLRMVSLEGAEIASRRAYLEELSFVDAAENERVAKVLEILTENRLIVRGVFVGEENRTYVEPAHDALVWGWGTLWNWIKALGKDNLFLQDRLREQVRLYRESKQDERLLWDDDPRLEQARSALFPNVEEAAFITESVNKRNRLIAAERERAAAERQLMEQKLKTEQRARRRQRLLTSMIGVALLIAVGLAFWALQQQQVAQTNAALARKSEEVARQNASLAEISAEEANAAEEDARRNAEEARLNEQEANRQAQQATIQRQRANAALLNLNQTQEQVVDLLIEQANGLIYNLDYEAALDKLETANKLVTSYPSLGKVYLEMAFYHGETYQFDQVEEWLNRAAGLLDRQTQWAVTADTTANLERLREALAAIDAEYYQELMKKYYPLMVEVPGGTFCLGRDPKITSPCDASEHPLVTLTGFELAQTETTVWQFHLFAQATGREMETPGWGLLGDNPVVNISWYDAVAYANWVSVQQGLQAVYEIDKNDVSADTSANGFRLPREAEWEYAARGGREQDPYIYSGSNSLDSVGWYDINSGNRSRPVAQKRANALGVYDMSGNVWERCWDWYGDYSPGATTNPIGPDSGSYRVLRGGSWYNGADGAEVSFRIYNYPDVRSDAIGFRLARSGRQ